MASVLLVGSGAGLINLAKKIKHRGHHLTVLGGLKDDPCHLIGDDSIFVDYRDFDSVLATCVKYKFDFVVPGSNDIAFECARRVAEQMQLSFFDKRSVIDTLHSKNKFRRLLKELDCSQPTVYDVSDVRDPNFIGWPVIVKPVDSFSGRGISVVRNLSNFEASIDLAKSASRTGDAIIESFVNGRLYSISCFLVNGIIEYRFFSNEFCFINPFAVDSSFTPSDLSETIQTAVVSNVELIVEKLSLVDGLLHIQFIYDPENNAFYFIECMRRLIGDFFGKKINLAYGFDYDEFYLRPYLGEITPRGVGLPVPLKIHRDVIGRDTDFVFLGYMNEKRYCIVDYLPFKVVGDLVGPYPGDKAGIVFYEKDVGK